MALILRSGVNVVGVAGIDSDVGGRTGEVPPGVDDVDGYVKLTPAVLLVGAEGLFFPKGSILNCRNAGFAGHQHCRRAGLPALTFMLPV